MSRWTVMDPELHTMPVADAVADRAIAEDHALFVKQDWGVVEVVPDTVRGRELALGDALDQELVRCRRNDGRCVYLGFNPKPGMPSKW